MDILSKIIKKKKEELEYLKKNVSISKLEKSIYFNRNGADAILLIAACLNDTDILKLSNLAKSIGLEVLIEIHEIEELKKSSIETVDIIGINNRDLKTFDVNIETSLNLINKIPSSFTKISESGLNSSVEINKLKNHGFDGFLIGERFMKSQYPGKELSNFISKIKDES